MFLFSVNDYIRNLEIRLFLRKDSDITDEVLGGDDWQYLNSLLPNNIEDINNYEVSFEYPWKSLSFKDWKCCIQFSMSSFLRDITATRGPLTYSMVFFIFGMLRKIEQLSGFMVRGITLSRIADGSSLLSIEIFNYMSDSDVAKAVTFPTDLSDEQDISAASNRKDSGVDISTGNFVVSFGDNKKDDSNNLDHTGDTDNDNTDNIK